MELNIVNDTTETAYLRFDNGSPAFSLVGTNPNNGTIDTTTSYTIEPNHTLSGFNIETLATGKLLFSLGDTLSTSMGTAFQSPPTGDSGVWWDKVEMTYLANAGTAVHNGTTYSLPAGGDANLSATDFFGLELQVQTFKGGTQQDELGWNPTITTPDEFAALANFYSGSTATADAVIPGETTVSNGLTTVSGVFVPSLNENVLRVIAPQTLPAADLDAFAWPQNYVTDVMNNDITTAVDGTFTGSPVTDYDFKATIPKTAGNGAQPGDLLMLGSIVINPGAGQTIETNQTIDIHAADLVAGIITANPTFYVNGTAETAANNDVFAAAVAAILGGFNYGFVDSKEANPADPGKTFGESPTDLWYVPQNASLAFADAQPTTGFYNGYAAELAKAGDAYGFPYTDLFPGAANPLAPLLNVGTTVVTILANNEPAAPCFVAGTRIRTAGEEVPVEKLVVGDKVMTLRGEPRPIAWIGKGRVLATRGRRNEATPVIVRKGALADNVPNRDLHVTKGHSLYLGRALIPVECLVNHRSIVWDDRAQEVEIYHIELDTHDVLIANGAPAESYRDDGNRWLFQNANSGRSQLPKPSCAPVLTGGAIVGAIWQQLLERAGPRIGLPLTDDADLHLWVDGKRIDAIERGANFCAFRLRMAPGSVRIRSRAAIPQELGIARDDRSLGVAIRRLVLAQARRQRSIDAASASLIDGYYRFEAENGIRWTDGDAAVPAELLLGIGGPCMLTLHIGAATRYIDDGTELRSLTA